jgi:4-diphosphocytidyl-2-C-methyl-D-erythritol kinase
MPTLTLPCPAKLNLMLHVTGRRADGYHNLQTVFQLLDYGDDITITGNVSGLVTIEPKISGLAQQDNLIHKAALLLRESGNERLGAQIKLNKRLPMGGGIGGGSSNAASTLLGLNRLWGINVDLHTLASLGRRLGADVPVFVYGKSAWAEGVGDTLTPLELPAPWYLVITPPCHVSTAEIFSHKDLTRDTLAIKVATFLERGGKNDCQKLVETLYPQVRDAVEWLNKFGQARLTGTGACIYAAFGSKNEAQIVFAKRPEHLKGFIAKGINRSPLHQCLTDQSITGV